MNINEHIKRDQDKTDNSHTEQKTNKTTETTIKNIKLHARPPPGHTIHVDLKHMPVSLDNNQYLCVFTDATTRVSTPIFLRTKDSFKTHYESYLQYVNSQSDW